MVKYFGTHKGKVFINVFVSLGAVLVILGALGKILHATWGTMAITIGMLAECIIFLMMAIVPVEHHVYWERYYPEINKDPLNEYDENGELPAQKVTFMPGRSSASSNPALDHLDEMLEQAEINPKNLKRLAENFEKFNNTINKISDSGAIAISTVDLSNKTKEATEALETLKKSYLDSAKEMNSNNFTEGIKVFYDQMFNLTKNISSLNNIYGVEIQDTLQEIKKIKGYFKNMNDVSVELNSTITEVQQSREQISILVNNLSNLNEVYGRVLTAMQGK